MDKRDMSRRQTVTYLTRRLGEVGIRPDTRRGQNFLVDLNLLELLVDTAAVGPEDVVLEIGTGTGSLTALVAPFATAVVTVEIDRQLHQLAKENLVDFDNVTLLQGDALKNKNQLRPDFLDVVRDQLDVESGRRFKLVANLPYSVATPVISNLIATDLVPDTITVTIQKELADRITARPGTKDYSGLSIWIQSQCDARIVRVIPPSAFWPRPKVHSAIIQIRTQMSRRLRISDRKAFHVFVRSMFFHRRKYLRSVLLSSHKKVLSKQDVDIIMASMGLAANSRAEQLSVKDMLTLFETVRARAAGPKL